MAQAPEEFSSKPDEGMSQEEQERREEEAKELLGEDWEILAETQEELGGQVEAAEDEIEDNSGDFQKDLEDKESIEKTSESLGVSGDAELSKNTTKKLEELSEEASKVAETTQRKIEAEVGVEEDETKEVINELLGELGGLNNKKTLESKREAIQHFVENGDVNEALKVLDSDPNPNSYIPYEKIKSLTSSDAEQLQYFVSGETNIQGFEPKDKLMKVFEKEFGGGKKDYEHDKELMKDLAVKYREQVDKIKK